MTAYRILHSLGRGTGAEVAAAEDVATGRTIALKLLDAAPTPEVLERLGRELALSRRLGHPALVRLLDTGVLDGRAFQAMELVEGRSLRDALAAAPFPPPRALAIAAALADGLAALHAAGAVHRDVKPGNIVLRADGSPVLTDLDGAALAPAEMAPGTDLVGSPAYLAPEIIDDRPADGRADVFSLGVVLYWMLTGRRPFEGTAAQVVEAIRTTEPLPPSHWVPQLVGEVEWLVLDCLSKDPACRPTARQLAGRLAEIVGPALPPVARPLAVQESGETRGAGQSVDH